MMFELEDACAMTLPVASASCLRTDTLSDYDIAKGMDVVFLGTIFGRTATDVAARLYSPAPLLREAHTLIVSDPLMRKTTVGPWQREVPTSASLGEAASSSAISTLALRTPLFPSQRPVPADVEFMWLLEDDVVQASYIFADTC